MAKMVHGHYDSNANYEVWLHHFIITSMEGCVSSFAAPPQPPSRVQPQPPTA